LLHSFDRNVDRKRAKLVVFLEDVELITLKCDRERELWLKLASDSNTF